MTLSVVIWIIVITLQLAGICRFVVRAGVSGLWTVYFVDQGSQEVRETVEYHNIIIIIIIIYIVYKYITIS